MPLYDYRCTACAQVVEVIHGINDSGPQRCEHCGGAMRKALSAPAIHFKGRGWAKKDAAAATAKKPKAGAASDKGSTKGNGDKSAGADAKSATDSSATSTSSTESTSKAAPTSGGKAD